MITDCCNWVFIWQTNWLRRFAKNVSEAFFHPLFDPVVPQRSLCGDSRSGSDPSAEDFLAPAEFDTATDETSRLWRSKWRLIGEEWWLIWLVGGPGLNPVLKNDGLRQLGWIYGKIKLMATKPPTRWWTSRGIRHRGLVNWWFFSRWKNDGWPRLQAPKLWKLTDGRSKMLRANQQK